MPRAISAKFPNAHPNKLMNYVFNMRLTPVEPDALPIVDLPTLDSEDEEEDATAGKAGAEESVDIDHLVSPPPEQVDAASETEEEDEDIQPDGKIAKVICSWLLLYTIKSQFIHLFYVSICRIWTNLLQRKKAET